MIMLEFIESGRNTSACLPNPAVCNMNCDFKTYEKEEKKKSSGVKNHHRMEKTTTIVPFFLNTATSVNKAGFAVPLRVAIFLLTAHPAAFIRAARSLRGESRAVLGH